MSALNLTEQCLGLVQNKSSMFQLQSWECDPQVEKNGPRCKTLFHVSTKFPFQGCDLTRVTVPLFVVLTLSHIALHSYFYPFFKPAAKFTSLIWRKNYWLNSWLKDCIFSDKTVCLIEYLLQRLTKSHTMTKSLVWGKYFASPLWFCTQVVASHLIVKFQYIQLLVRMFAWQSKLTKVIIESNRHCQ